MGLFDRVRGGVRNFLGGAEDFLFGGPEQVNTGDTDFARRLAQQQYEGSQFGDLFAQQQARFGQLGGLASSGMTQNVNGQFAGFQDGATGLDAFMAYSPQIQQLAFGQFSPMQEALNQQAADQARMATQVVGQQYAGLGAGRSGAAAAAIAEAAARPFAQVQNQLGMQQAGFGAQMQQQLLDLTNQQRQFDMNYQLALAQGQQNLLGMELQRQQAAFNALQGLGTPTYIEQPGFLDRVNQVAGTVSNVGSMFAGFGG